MKDIESMLKCVPRVDVCDIKVNDSMEGRKFTEMRDPKRAVIWKVIFSLQNVDVVMYTYAM